MTVSLFSRDLYTEKKCWISSIVCAGSSSDVVIAGEGGIAEGDSDDFLVPGFLIHHLDDPDGITAHQRHGDDAFLAEHQHIERVAVLGIGAGDEPVVCRIVGGGVQDAVEPEQAGFLVHLVFVFAALGNFDDRGKILGADARRGDVMPDVHRHNHSFWRYFPYYIPFQP